MFTERRATKLMRQGQVAVGAGDYITALHAFKAAAFVARTPCALTNWGTMEHSLGDTARAIELCNEAIALDPEWSSAYNDIGFYLVALGRPDEAMPWFQRAIAAQDADAEPVGDDLPVPPRQIAHTNLGKLYYERHNYQDALHHFEEVLRHDPENPEVLALAQSSRAALQ